MDLKELIPIFGCMQKHAQLVLLGKRIRDLRISKGYSQEAFAAEADLDRAYYGGVERGERNVAALNLIKIASALGIEMGALFPRVSALQKATKGG